MKRLASIAIVLWCVNASAISPAVVANIFQEPKTAFQCVAWYDQKGITNLVDSSLVVRWLDNVSRENDLTPLVAAVNSPLFSNTMVGKYNGVMFDGVADFLQSKTNLSFGSLTQMTAILICNTNCLNGAAIAVPLDVALTNSGAQEIAFWLDQATPKGYGVLHNAGGAMQATYTSLPIGAPWMNITGRWGILSNDVAVFINGVAGGSPTLEAGGTFLNFAKTNRSLYVGSRVTGISPARFHVLEIVMFWQRFSDSQVYYLTQMYKRKYGVLP